MNAHIIINTLRCKTPLSTQRKIAPLKTRAGIGKVVDVIGPAKDCECCVSVLPDWEPIEDERGHTCRRDNLMKIPPDEAILTEQDEAIPA